MVWKIVKWCGIFKKYLIDENGKLVAVIHPQTEVISEDFLSKI